MMESAWRTLRSQSNVKQKTRKKNTFVISIGTLRLRRQGRCGGVARTAALIASEDTTVVKIGKRASQ